MQSFLHLPCAGGLVMHKKSRGLPCDLAVVVILPLAIADAEMHITYHW